MSICAQAPLYRQREFHQSPLWRILVDHGEEFLRSYDSRYEETHGPLPLQSARVVEKLLRCGDPRHGLTLLPALIARSIMAVPFSCKTRVCPSCINRRAEVLSHTLAEKLPEGDYRHLVVTLPKKMGCASGLADWVQHIPRSRQHQVTYAGHFANALGNLSTKQEGHVSADGQELSEVVGHGVVGYGLALTLGHCLAEALLHSPVASQ